MYGEMVSVRARANALREIADELRGSATTLTLQSDAMTWKSPAGDSFRNQLHGLAGEIGAHASALQDAAGALERHVTAVEGTKRAIQDAQAWVTARIDEAARAVRQAGEDTVGAVEGAIASAARDVPAAGSRDWLDFRQLFEKKGWAQ
ncbi:hypothetical protein G3T36_09050 [Diaminobutyricibacter tongyongensis]|uniref:Uncharacterized protein n=1 Tax=Leifsonia tongyongensis TaxID=1268043 RepID=A0A6L9XX74_9MICO|nr:hypothetical protein [Diaminobutyricibacter tongyongensis]NEN06021.1 hypothetical protein [Diaminobutyricibacter tongyongensis]